MEVGTRREDPEVEVGTLYLVSAVRPTSQSGAPDRSPGSSESQSRKVSGPRRGGRGTRSFAARGVPGGRSRLPLPVGRVSRSRSQDKTANWVGEGRVSRCGYRRSRRRRPRHRKVVVKSWVPVRLGVPCDRCGPLPTPTVETPTTTVDHRPCILGTGCRTSRVLSRVSSFTGSGLAGGTTPSLWDTRVCRFRDWV